MAEIQAAEIKAYRSVAVGDTSANGGVMSDNVAVTGLKNNVFPDVSLAERTAGVTQLRKMFHKVENSADEILYGAEAHLVEMTEGDDYVTLLNTTANADELTDTQGDLSGEDEYGIGALSTDADAADTSIVVTTEMDSPIVFRTGDKICISRGNGTYFEYFDSITVTDRTNNVYTIALNGSLTYAYTQVQESWVASVIAIGDVAPSYESDETGIVSAGDFDDTTYPVVLNNIGTVEDIITLTVGGGGTTFTAQSTLLGSLVAGSVGVLYEPSHTVFGVPYFSIPALVWDGTFADGDVIIITTHPAAFPLWRKRYVPAGAASLASNSYTVRVLGQTG